MVRVSRVWIYVLSAAALLVPAGGIAYLGAVSYRDDRGAVRALQERQQQAARAIAEQLTRAIEAALDEVDRATSGPGPEQRGTAHVEHPLARHWFWIDADQQLRVPRAVPAALELVRETDRDKCEGARLEVCMREDLTREDRGAALHAAQRAETNHKHAEARGLYSKLVDFDDTGAAALIGLARVYATLGDPPKASQALSELEKRFADRSIDGVPVRVLVATLNARRNGTDALLALADDLLRDKYKIDPIIRLGVLARIRALLGGNLPEEQARHRAELDERIAILRREARAAAALADELNEIGRSATPVWRGRTSTREPLRTLIFRRRADGGVTGISVDAPMLEEAAAGDDRARSVATHGKTMILPAGGTPGPHLRSVVQVPLGTNLPHLSLAIVNPVADADPLDEVIRARSRRHVMYTSALALLLGLGLLATIRGAVRARELAQLKSDFVSTVSHELKTPLTSIRMFAEMLEQGVAQGDPQKQARYQGVIVQESQRLGLLIANLLDYAQIERGTRRYSRVPAEIEQLARQAVATFEILRDPERTGRNPVEVVVSSDAMHPAHVDVDRDVVVQAVLNLVTNAAKYGGDKPIEVLCGASATEAWISVRDQGPGIPESEQVRIFKEFYRTPDAYRSNVEGTGLGLALVKRHIEALGGTVEVVSDVGQGATFTIKFPRVQEPA